MKTIIAPVSNTSQTALLIPSLFTVSSVTERNQASLVDPQQSRLKGALPGRRNHGQARPRLGLGLGLAVRPEPVEAEAEVEKPERRDTKAGKQSSGGLALTTGSDTALADAAVVWQTTRLPLCSPVDTLSEY